MVSFRSVAVTAVLTPCFGAHPLKVSFDNSHARLLAAFDQVGKAPAPALAGAPGPAAAGLCGCEHVPQDQCTCDGSLQYLKCVAKACGKGDCECPENPFMTECHSLAGDCGSELSITGCGSHLTECEGRFNQASDGTIGLTLDVSHLQEESYCGPYGRCTGELHLHANVYRHAPGVFLECVLPVKGKKELVHCTAAVSDDGAGGCDLPMVDRLYPDEELKGRCYLTDGDGGAKLSKDAWFAVSNRYSGPAPPAEDEVATVAKDSKALKVVTKDKQDKKDKKDEKKEKVEEKEEKLEVKVEEKASSKEEKEEQIDEEAIAQQKAESGAKKGGGAIMGTNGWFILFLVLVICAIGAGLIYLKSKRSAA